MKAAVLTHQGLALVNDHIEPTPGPEEVLVRMRAAALNRADLAVLAGHQHGSVGGLGTVPGMEWAGEVVATGAAVQHLKAGDRVMGSGRAAMAELVVADMGRVLPLPDPSMGFDQATTLPMALQTLHDALVSNGGLQAGESVLIQGASSGVGLMGLQMAKLLGASVVIGSSTHPERRAQLAAFGADLAIDSGAPDWPEQVRAATGGRGVDLVIDMLSGPTVNASMQAAAVCGRIVNVGRLAGMTAEFDFDLHALKRLRYVGVTFRTRSVAEVRAVVQAMRAQLWPALQAGRLALPIAATYPFEQVQEAYALMAANRHFGKIVVQGPVDA